MDYKNSIKDSIYKNSIIMGNSTLWAIENFQREINEFLQELIQGSMFPVVDAYRLTDNKMSFLALKYQGVKDLEGESPYQIAKYYTQNSDYLNGENQYGLNLDKIKGLDLCTIKKDFTLEQKSFDIQTNPRQTFCNILDDLDLNFQQLLDKNSIVRNNEANWPIQNYIIQSCSLIAQRTRRGAGNNILINNAIYKQLKPLIPDSAIVNYTNRKVLNVGRLSQSIDVYLNTRASEDCPIYVWYSSPSNSIDVPFVLIEDRITFDLNQDQLINDSCFLDNNIDQNYQPTSNYVYKLLWQ